MWGEKGEKPVKIFHILLLYINVIRKKKLYDFYFIFAYKEVLSETKHHFHFGWHEKSEKYPYVNKFC